MNRRRRILRLVLLPWAVTLALFGAGMVEFAIWGGLLLAWLYGFFIWAPKGPDN